MHELRETHAQRECFCEKVKPVDLYVSDVQWPATREPFTVIHYYIVFFSKKSVNNSSYSRSATGF